MEGLTFSEKMMMLMENRDIQIVNQGDSNKAIKYFLDMNSKVPEVE
jgi:hypothetical protein